MKQQLNKVLIDQNWKNTKIVLAVSGGCDSMAMAALLKELGQPIVLAHCNFGLRAAESDGDEQLVTEWAAAHEVPCYVQHFDTRQILATTGGNLQETARMLRYEWFESLRKELQFDFIATAHHKQDSVETMLINFFKGTGIAGMHGILPQQHKIIRPLLSFTKEMLQAYAIEQGVPWREDSSNKKEDYTRNAIRHQLFPVLEKMFPNVLHNLATNTTRFAEVETLYKEAVGRHTAKLIEQRLKDWYIPVLKLKKLPAQKTILWEMLQPFGFSAAQLPDIHHLMDSETGRYVASSSHRILKNRDFLIVTSLETTESSMILIQQGEEQIAFGERALFCHHKNIEVPDLEQLKKLSVNEICVDAASVHFPLIIRPWKQGDYFYPLGTQPKKKKVSKYLIEQKVPLHEKENVWVVESNKKIMWVIGFRADDRFKIKPHSVKGIFISVK